ncbi:MAG: Acb2/Tad1 domain-containing protein [Armatimonadota bacterium]
MEENAKEQVTCCKENEQKAVACDRDLSNVERTIMDLQNRFTYHPPKGDQAARYEIIRKAGLEFAMQIMRCCPDSRERSLAITSLEDSVMRANRAIAINE